MSGACRDDLHPLYLFVTLLERTGFSYSLLLDLMMSPETLFLVYLVQSLKHIAQSWTQWTQICQNFDVGSRSIQTASGSELGSSSRHTQRGSVARAHLLECASVKHVIVEYSSSSDEDDAGCVDDVEDVRLMTSDGVVETLERVMSVLSQLTNVLSRLVDNDVFSFDVQPLLRHLRRCQLLYRPSN